LFAQECLGRGTILKNEATEKKERKKKEKRKKTKWREKSSYVKDFITAFT
jgi:hypothetical protein